ncbi:MAG: glycoside hydrolase family 9 protein [Actinomycetes bacterium]
MVALLVVAGATPAAADVTNGSFDDGETGWFAYGFAATTTDGGRFCGEVPASAANPWDAAVGQNFTELAPGEYTLTYTASGDGAVTAVVGQGAEPYAQYWTSATTVTPEPATVVETVTITGETSSPQLAFQVGGNAGATFCLDDVSLVPAGTEYLSNTDFATETAPWWTSNVTSSALVDGVWCLDIPGGTTNPWDVIVGYNDVGNLDPETGQYVLPAGPYTLSFTGSGAGPVRAIVGDNGAPYGTYGELIQTAPDGTYSTSFTLDEPTPSSPELPNLQVAFQVGGSASPWTFCLDEASLIGGGAVEEYSPDTGPRVRVNQVGYLTGGPKQATLVTEASEPVAWQLLDGATVVAESMTTVQGVDASAGVNVHLIDFSDVTDPGAYTLAADGETSYEFEIGTEAYQQLRYDSLNYFYLARSGIEIDGAIVGEDYAREAGHVSSPADGVANKGDLDVPCQNVTDSQAVYGEPWTCDYTLDVVGGWYDAGDHGKYVVNGGIATAQLLGTYERSLTAPGAAADALADGTLDVPESSNGVPDVLDEARWELEFMLAMQVPDGEQYAGMVHHKIHDDGWTGLPLMPAADPQVRELHRPSTAATLNVAATAAQGARLFEAYDPDFAADLLEAARSTWEAALGTPALYAPAADGADGGGPYDDDDVTDEFYWAAAELFLTTGEQEFADFLADSPIHTADSFPTTAFSWDALDAIAKMNLATVPNDLADRDAIVAQVIDGADAILAVQEEQEFGLALPDDAFVWGSNSQVLNNQVVLATAFDLTGERAYADAVVESMDYLLGRNALNQSYVTGYGEVYSENQHSRWFSAQLNGDLPHPPAGSVAGGPNTTTSTWDPTFAALYPDQDCAPQWCYVDHIQSWSTNEITVNWNSALSWVASFVADLDQADRIGNPPFSDVHDGLEHYEAIRWMWQNGMTTGFDDGTFRPFSPITRDAVAAFMYRLADPEGYVAPETSHFTDITPENTEFYTEINWLYDAGISTGWPDGTFRPQGKTTRDAMAAFLYRYLEPEGYEAPATSHFTDVTTENTEFYTEINWLYDAGISTGWADGTFRKASPITRDAYSAFLYRIMTAPA